MKANFKNREYFSHEYEKFLENLLNENALHMVLRSTKLLNLVPSSSGIEYRTYPSFAKIINAQSEKILIIISKILKLQNIKGNIERRQQDEQLEMISNCNDIILEKINHCIDNLSSKTVTLLDDSQHENEEPSKFKQIVRRKMHKMNDGLNINRPQINFTCPVDNTNTPFVPIIKTKPNSLVPLLLKPIYDDSQNILSFAHPYEFELKYFEPRAEFIEKRILHMPTDISLTEYIFVDRKEQIQEIVGYLKNEKQLAIDLEHHSYRSYQGFTCLLQISSRKKDFIVDTLALRDDLQILNDIFTDPKILKVFHGANLDVEWLQRDLGLYIVNMFDTYQAAKILGFKSLSLKFLLKHYCNVDADKKFQMADWRIRPLPTELISYARQDTHFLLYIADNLQNAILTLPNGLSTLKVVYNSCKNVCEKVYVKPIVNNDSYMDIYRRSKRYFDNRQLHALKEIYIWRDNIARQEDESCDYVLPNHMLLQIAENLPREMQGILACCNPIPSFVKKHLNVLHNMILKAREESLIKAYTHVQPYRLLYSSNDFCGKLYNLFDIPLETEFSNQNVQFSQILNIKSSNITNVPVINIFEVDNIKKPQNVKQNINTNQDRSSKFASPYQRYLAVISKNLTENKNNFNTMVQNMKSDLAKYNQNIASFVDFIEDKKNNTSAINVELIKENLENVSETSLERQNASKQNLAVSLLGKSHTFNAKVVDVDEKKTGCIDYSKIELKLYQKGSKLNKSLNTKRNNKVHKLHKNLINH